MISIRQWVERQRKHRSRCIAEQINELQRDFDAERRSEHKNDFPNWDEECEQETLRRSIKSVVESYPEICYRPRTWVWFFRWALAILVAYIGIAFMAHALRHPEMTETQRFLDFWSALLWQ